ncbi:hypothetical protein [Helicovermis profundi]|uniref:DUF1080 domain-containing protein n=1 Tax=Helicovermis profundi TaxID=3065157 RepID=A0AAU9EGG7_9FIRM|nr:hypothetical protein HLPR_21830 [Clostridia bacterium S502]
MIKRIVALLLFIGLIIGFYFYQFNNLNRTKVAFTYEDDFNTINRDFWYVGEWETGFPAYDRVNTKNGILTLEDDETDRGPYLLSKPLPVVAGDVITIERRIKLHYANDHFTGGFALMQTNSDNLKPKIIDNDWVKSLGEGAVLVEYTHNYNKKATRPGRDIFRILPPNWKQDYNYQVTDPIFDDWFEEKLIYDTRNNKITYILNGKEYKVNGVNINKKNIRIFTHSYGWFTGHYMKIDWIKIKIEDKRFRTQK